MYLIVRLSVCAGWESVGDTMQVVMEYVKKCNEECLANEQVPGSPWSCLLTTA